MTEPTAPSSLPHDSPPLLEIPAEIRDAMIDHCRREAPLECCGFLGGKDGRVMSIHPLRNIADSETRYLADPQEAIRAWVGLREQGRQILAIYHSHPRWQAVPSQTDLEENHWGDTPRLIVSLLTDPPEIRVWKLEPDSYTELPWRPVDHEESRRETLQAPRGSD
jgi:proteasome lid subunit RPN8/RPN11